jgi:spermidine/putrescine transport system substrate-binding protein
MKRCILIMLVLLTISSQTIAGPKVVNVYIWGGEIPKSVVHKFEQDTGIKVNFSTYDSNETMYAKLKSSRKMVYDVIMPSSYFVERMRNQGMLTKLDKQKLPNQSNLSKPFTNNEYDPLNQYSMPINWGATGIFYNREWVKNAPTSWMDLWSNEWKQRLLMLDDSREVFSIGLLSLGFQPNDTDVSHINEAFKALMKLGPNIKMFASDSVQAIVIDGDAHAGAAWNGDAFKSNMENPNIQFVYPKEGFVIWVDCLSIPVNAPHVEEAYAFINYMMKPESASEIARIEGHATANAKGKALLPRSTQDNPIVYPSDETLKRGYFQRYVGQKTIAVYNYYWERFKLSF